MVNNHFVLFYIHETSRTYSYDDSVTMMTVRDIILFVVIMDTITDFIINTTNYAIVQLNVKRHNLTPTAPSDMPRTSDMNITNRHSVQTTVAYCNTYRVSSSL